jgi:hypothetical protein
MINRDIQYIDISLQENPGSKNRRTMTMPPQLYMIPRGSRDSCPDAISRPFLYTPHGAISEAVEETEIRCVPVFDPKALGRIPGKALK